MFKIPLKRNNILLQFIWQMLILLGMVITFYVVAGFFSLSITKVVFKIDLFNGLHEIIRNPLNYPNEMLALKFNQVIISIGIFVIPAYLFCKSIDENPIDFLNIKTYTKSYNFIFIIFLMAAAIPLSAWLANVNSQIHFPEQLKFIEDFLRGNETENKQLTEAFVLSNSILDLILNLFVIAIIPAIAEELFFRACIQNYVFKAFNNLHFSVIFTAIVFSAIHADYSGFLPRFMLGLVLGYAFIFSKNIWVPILGHFFNNSLSLIFVFIEKKHPEIIYFKEDYMFPTYVTISSFIIILTILFVMYKNHLTKTKNEQLD